MLVRDCVRGKDARLRGLRLGLVAAIEQPQRVAFLNRVAVLLLGGEADPRVNLIFDAQSPPPD